MRRFERAMGVAAAALLFAGAAAAQYTADFESPEYSLGQLEGQGIWINWVGTNNAFSQVVNTQNHTPSGSQAMEISNGADTVADFDALGGGSFDSGQWTLTAYSFVPTGSTGTTFFMVMNHWDVSGAPGYEWNLQLGLDASAGRAVLYTPGGVIQRALVFNQWVEIRAVYDLTANSVDVYYDNMHLETYDPRCGVTGGCGAPYSGSFIDALDLYPDPGTNPSPIFFDDIRIESGGGTSGTAICFGDGSGAPCGCANESTTSSESGCRNSVSGSGGAQLAATGTASSTSNTLGFDCTNVRTQPGLLFSGNNTIGGGTGQTFGDGVRCCGAGVVRIELINPPVGPEPLTVTTTATIPPQPAGTKRCYQYWYRDPGGPCGLNFNLSNAVTVTWIL